MTMTVSRGLNSTGPKAETLQADLWDQLKGSKIPTEFLSHIDITTQVSRRQDEPGPTVSGESSRLASHPERDSPRLWAAPLELVHTAVTLQKWEGVVTKITDSTFLARLRDQSANNPEEEIELSTHDVSDDDQNLVTQGAIFYLSVGYEKSAGGVVKRTSGIRFRRLPVWTLPDLAGAKREAEELGRAIGWGHQSAAAKAG